MVNGAELIDILVLINKNFLKWVIVACVLALPLGWFIMKGWLETFAQAFIAAMAASISLSSSGKDTKRKVGTSFFSKCA